MMKRKLLLFCLVLAAFWLVAGVALATATDPIVCSIELDPNRLSGPGTINVTITISNSGDTDMTDPLVLYDPAAQIVSDFGQNGAVVLKAGESVTWTGTYDVNQRTLDNGFLVYFATYNVYRDSGEAVETNQAIRATIGLQEPESDMDVNRTVSPTIAREGQDVVVRYDISNSGTVTLENVTIQENADIDDQVHTIGTLQPGHTAEVVYPVVMGTEDLTSGAVITYTSEVDDGKQTYTVENMAIAYGEPALEATLNASAKGVMANSPVTLTLELKNTGSVDYTDLRVTDPALGDVFTNQTLAAGESLTLEREVTLPETMDYQFTVTAMDNTGNETVTVTDAVTVTAVAPEDVLNLVLTATPDRTEVFESPGLVRFTLTVENTSAVDATEVVISHGNTELYTFSTIPAGATRTLSRDTALSMAGKYRFTATAKDPLENEMTFESNEIQIAFSVPTQAPVTPEPAQPTPEPVFTPVTVPPITDRSIGTIPKTIQSVLLPLLIAAGVVLAACCVLLLVALKRRADRKRTSKSAIDQLERAKHRDYVSQPEEEADEEQAPPVTQDEDEPWAAAQTPEDEESESDQELPHLKYVRSAMPPQVPEETADTPMNGGYYDEDMPAAGAYDDSQDEPDDSDDGYDGEPMETYDEPEDEGYDPAAYSDEAYADLDGADEAVEDGADEPVEDVPSEPAQRGRQGGRRRSRNASASL